MDIKVTKGAAAKAEMGPELKLSELREGQVVVVGTQPDYVTIWVARVLAPYIFLRANEIAFGVILRARPEGDGYEDAAGHRLKIHAYLGEVDDGPNA